MENFWGNVSFKQLSPQWCLTTCFINCDSNLTYWLSWNHWNLPKSMRNVFVIIIIITHTYKNVFETQWNSHLFYSTCWQIIHSKTQNWLQCVREISVWISRNFTMGKSCSIVPQISPVLRVHCDNCDTVTTVLESTAILPKI